jgi:hypothetical protein
MDQCSVSCFKDFQELPVGCLKKLGVSGWSQGKSRRWIVAILASLLSSSSTCSLETQTMLFNQTRACLLSSHLQVGVPSPFYFLQQHTGSVPTHSLFRLATLQTLTSLQTSISAPESVSSSPGDSPISQLGRSLSIARPSPRSSQDGRSSLDGRKPTTPQKLRGLNALVAEVSINPKESCYLWLLL